VAATRTLVTLALGLASLSVACRERQPKSSDAPPAPAPSRSAAALPDASAPDASAPDATAMARPAPSPEALAAYARGLATGRAATKKGDTGVAVQAFTDALASLPDDPQATGERGFAKLQAGDNEGARVDFERAIELGGSPTLRAQLHFNVGLLEEKAGHMDAARSAYARSQRLHPTAAAAAKLAGHIEACPLAFEEPSPITEYASWFDAVRALRPAATAATGPAARAVLCAADSAECRELEDGRVLLVVDADGRTVDAVIEDGTKVYVVRKVSERISGSGFKCPDALPTVRAQIDRGIARFDRAATLCNTVCTTRNWVDCSWQELGTRHSVAIWDLSAKQPVVGVTWDDPTSFRDSLEELTVDDEGMLRFQGCNLRRRIPFHRDEALDGARQRSGSSR
jgi:tetratricopeptide (TPR) repeat protein